MEYINIVLKLIFFLAFLYYVIPNRDIREVTVKELMLYFIMIEMIMISITKNDLGFFFLSLIIIIIMMKWKMIWRKLQSGQTIQTNIYSKINKEEPVPVIISGMIEEQNLMRLHKDITWVNEVLQKENIALNRVYYAFYYHRNMHIIVY